MTNYFKSIDDALVNSLCSSFQKNNKIKKEDFSKYPIKRGLRNSDGTGVLAGLTNIANVHGYILNEGEKEPIDGKLTYRGIDLYQLIEGFEKENRFGYEEVSYLLMCGALPNKKELEIFSHTLGHARDLPHNFTEDMIMRAPSPDIMNKLASATLALYSYDTNPDECTTENIMRQGMALLAKFPVIVSHAYQAKRRYYDNTSMFLHVPNPDKSTAENILGLIRPDGKYTDVEAKLLDMCLIVHAEHGGGNNSSFTTRVTSSSGTDTYAAISSAISSLKGPKHGGANIKVNGMFDDIKANVADCTDEEQVFAYLCKLLNREGYDKTGLIYGMGHAIYTKSDPRAIILKSKLDIYLTKETNEALFADYQLIQMVERLTPSAFLKVRGEDKVMCANVDMYSGILYKYLNIPSEMITPLFATARIAGWIAHRLEEITTGGKIIRPAYKPLVKKSCYTSLENRE